MNAREKKIKILINSVKLTNLFEIDFSWIRLFYMPLSNIYKDLKTPWLLCKFKWKKFLKYLLMSIKNVLYTKMFYLK